jgi:hypothetical protein
LDEIYLTCFSPIGPPSEADILKRRLEELPTLSAITDLNANVTARN